MIAIKKPDKRPDRSRYTGKFKTLDLSDPEQAKRFKEYGDEIDASLRIPSFLARAGGARCEEAEQVEPDA